MDRRDFLRLGGITLTSLSLGLGPLSGEAFARGSSKEEAERAQSIFERLEAGGKQSSPMIMGPGAVCMLEPGGMLTFEIHGYCLDQNFSAPARNEPLAFRPMTDYIAPELRELYVRVMRNAKTSKGKAADVQKIVWAMRAPANSSWSQGFNGADRAFLESVLPDGTRLLQTAQRSSPHVAEGTSGGSGRDGNGGGGSGAAALLGFLLPAIVGQLPYDIRRHSNDLMNQLQNRQAQNPMAGSLYCYSMLTDSGVAGKGIAIEGLIVRGIIANGSPDAFTFDPPRWVMESSRDVQAVALPSLEHVKVSKGKAQSDKTPPQSTENPKPRSGSQREDGFHEFATEPQS